MRYSAISALAVLVGCAAAAPAPAGADNAVHLDARALKKVRVPTCNPKHIKLIEKAHKHPVTFCRRYKPKKGAKSPIKGFASAAALKSSCACYVKRREAQAHNSAVAKAAKKTSTKKSTKKTTKTSAKKTTTKKTTSKTTKKTTTTFASTTISVSASLASSANQKEQQTGTTTTVPTVRVGVPIMPYGTSSYSIATNVAPVVPASSSVSSNNVPSSAHASVAPSSSANAGPVGYSSAAPKSSSSAASSAAPVVPSSAAPKSSSSAAPVVPSSSSAAASYVQPTTVKSSSAAPTTVPTTVKTSASTSAAAQSTTAQTSVIKASSTTAGQSTSAAPSSAVKPATSAQTYAQTYAQTSAQTSAAQSTTVKTSATIQTYAQTSSIASTTPATVLPPTHVGQIVSTSAASSSALPTTSSTLKTTTTSVAVPAPTGFCPTADNTTVNGYTVHCSSDSSVISYGSGSASSSYLDCMTLCNADSKCQGAVYVGTTNGKGSGVCYIKSPVGTITPAGSNFIAIVKNNYVAPTTSTTANVAAPTTGSKASTGTVASLSCPAANGTIYTSATGSTFQVECGIDHRGGDLSWLYVNSLTSCVEVCASTAGCVDVSLSGAACYLKKSLGLALYGNPNLSGAKLITASSS